MQKEHSGVTAQYMMLKKYRAAQRRSDCKFGKKGSSRGFIQTKRSMPGKGRSYRLRASKKPVALDWARVIKFNRELKHERYRKRQS